MKTFLRFSLLSIIACGLPSCTKHKSTTSSDQSTGIPWQGHGTSTTIADAPTLGDSWLAFDHENNAYTAISKCQPGTDGGGMRKQLAGATAWSNFTPPANAPAQGMTWTGLANDSNGNLLAVGNYGLYTLAAGAKEWEVGALPDGVVKTIAVDSSDTAWLLIADPWEIWKKPSGSDTWTKSDSLPTFQSVNDITVPEAIAFHSGSVFVGGYAFSSAASQSGVGSSVSVIRKSSDNGATWTTVDTLPMSHLSFIVADSKGHLFARGANTSDNGSALFRKSIDGGTTWSTIPNELFGERGSEPGGPIAVDAHDNLFLHKGAFFYKSADLGETWTKQQGIGSEVVIMSISSNGTIYAGGHTEEQVGGLLGQRVDEYAVSQSSDGGTTWTFTDEFPVSSL